MNDRRLIYAAAFLRALATGMVGVLLGLTLARLGFPAAAIGAVLSAGLAGATLALVVVTWAGDRLSRRRCLLGLSLLGAAGGLGAAWVSEPWAMAPGFAGWLMQAAALSAPLFIGAGMKIAYDFMLWRALRKLRPPEERR